MDEPGRKHRSLLHKSFGIVQTHCQNVKWVQELRWFIAVALLWHIQNLSNWTIFSPQRIIYIPSPHLVNRSYPFTLLHCSFIPPEGENTISPQFTTGFEVPTVSPPPQNQMTPFWGLGGVGSHSAAICSARSHVTTKLQGEKMPHSEKWVYLLTAVVHLTSTKTTVKLGRVVCDPTTVNYCHKLWLKLWA